MLKQRLITGIILAVAALYSILALPESGFALILFIVILLASWEWSRLLRLSNPGTLTYCGSVTFLIGIIWWVRHNETLLWGILVLAGCFWVYVLWWLLRYSKQPDSKDPISVLIVSGLVVRMPLVRHGNGFDK